MKKVKVIAAILLSLIMILSAASCGSSDSGGSKTPDDVLKVKVAAQPNSCLLYTSRCV